ncbi:MAG: hypothetical protein JWQ74_1074 [Marmoricola sp.]|nr:hypothetical protein [Marmoricola sp.]
MKNNTCETCGVRVLRRPAGESGRWVTLEASTVRPGRLRRGVRVRVIDGGKAYLPDHMAERLDLHQTPAQRLALTATRRPVDTVEDYPHHVEHQCGGQ